MAKFKVTQKGVIGKGNKAFAVGDVIDVELVDNQVPAWLKNKGRLIEVATPDKATATKK